MARKIVIIEDLSPSINALIQIVEEFKEPSDDVYVFCVNSKAPAGIYDNISFANKYVISSQTALIAEFKKLLEVNPGDMIVISDVRLEGVLDEIYQYKDQGVAQYFAELTRSQYHCVFLFYSGNRKQLLLVDELKGLCADTTKIGSHCSALEGKEKIEEVYKTARIIVLKAFDLFYGKPLDNIAIKELLARLHKSEIEKAKFQIDYEIEKIFIKDPREFLSSEKVKEVMGYDNFWNQYYCDSEELS